MNLKEDPKSKQKKSKNVIERKKQQILKDKKELEKIDPSVWEGFKDVIEKKDKICEKYNISEEIKQIFNLFIYRLLNYPIVNGVAPLSLGRPINIERVQEGCKKNNLQYLKYPKFSGLSVKFKEKNTKFTAIFFASGKVNLIGLKKDTPDHLKKIVEVLSKYEVDLFGELVLNQSTKRFANRVYSLKIPSIIDLSHLYLFNSLSKWKDIKYNSEAFPGAVIKFKQFKSKALCFRTGSIIITGIVSNTCKKQVLLQLIQIICEYLQLKDTNA